MKPDQKITPFIWFEKSAAEAADFYVSVFKNAKKTSSAILNGSPSERTEIVSVEIFGQEFTFMHSARPAEFKLSPAVSFVVHCKDQAEVDYYWEALSADPGSEACGWLKDRYGLSWQIVPDALPSYIGGPDKAGAKRAMEAMLKMKKLDIAKLEEAYEGEI